MFRKFLFIGAVMVSGIVVITGCSNDKTITPSDRTVLFTEGFEGDLTGKWEGVYMISSMERFDRMRVTTEAANSGTHSLTTDSNMTALYHTDTNRVESGTTGIEFYMKAQSLGQVNFGLEIGQNPGSSGAVTPAFGIFFDPSDSIKCIVFNSWPEVNTQIMIAPIQADHWYKCKIEVNMTDTIVSYYIDDSMVHSERILDALMGIDRLLVIRGIYGNNFSASSEGAKSYYIDDITWYKK
jgi:hypothetical protein